MDKYEVVKDLGAGSFGVAKLCRNKYTKEPVAIKFIERGPMIDENVEREIINHRLLQHPNVIRFKEVILTPTHLALVMEYAAGGELFKRIYKYGRFSEDEARHFFQQLISGVNYFHSMQICHRDLKLDNILLNRSPFPHLKICDFGYSKNLRNVSENVIKFEKLQKSSLLYSKPNTTIGSPTYEAPDVLAKGQYDRKSSLLHSKPNTIVGSPTYAPPRVLAKGQNDGKLYPLHSTPNTNVGSPTYAAPEVLAGGSYDGKLADVWSCGVTLYVMLVGAYPFEDPNDSKNFEKTITRTMAVQYTIPDYVQISQDCQHLLSRIFVRNPSMRISPKEIKHHPWFLKDLPLELKESSQAVYYKRNNPTFFLQSMEEIMKILGEARNPAPSSTTIVGFLEEEKDEEDEYEEDDEVELEKEEEDEEDEYEEDDEAELEKEEEDEEDEYEEDGEAELEEEEEDEEEDEEDEYE